MHSLLSPKQEPLDARWHRQLLLLMDMPGDLYAYLQPSSAALVKAREQFEASSRQELPVLRPPEAYRSGIQASLAGVLSLRETIRHEEQNEHVRALYAARIDELAANCRLWLAAADGDRAAFAQENEFLYGVPDAAMHAAACAWLREFADAQMSHPSVAVRTAAARVIEVTPDLPGIPGSLLPDENTYQAVRALHMQSGGFMASLFAGASLPGNGVVHDAEGDAIIERALANIGVPYTVADTDFGYWGVKHSTREVLRPAEYMLDTRMFTGIVAHEVGSHLLERVNGLRSQLQLAGSGLDRYEWGNEGRAYLREQVAQGSLEAVKRHEGWELTIAKHLGICLAMGTSGKQHTFTGVYDALFALYTLWALLRGFDERTATHKAADDAWNMGTRLLKGTDGQGGAYLKDIVYLEGNVRCWQVAAAHPDRIFWGDAGKFDIANEKHIYHLQALGVIPDSPN